MCGSTNDYADAFVKPLLALNVCKKKDKECGYPIHARFLVESDNFGRVRFKGISSGRYLCMTKSGVLIAKADRRFGFWRKGKKNRRDRHKRKSGKQKFMRRCVFREVFGRNAYTTYRLAANESWFLAVDKNGNPKLGPQTRSGMKAVHFIERPIGVKRDDDLSERTRVRIFRQRAKKKQAAQYQKRLRSLPLKSDIQKVDSTLINSYVKKFQGFKKDLKKAIKALSKLRRKIDEKKPISTTDQKIKYYSIFKRILSKLKVEGIVSN